MSNYWNKIFLGIAFILATATIALAQPKDNSPYSRLGLGDLIDQNFFAQGALGGLGAAFHDPYHMNIANPASYGRLRSAAFEIGLFTEYGSLKDGTGTNNNISTWNGNLSYLSLGFPLKNPINEVLDQKKKKVRWGMNFTLLPYSNVDYNIENQTIEQAFGDTIGVNYLFQGKGGTYKIMWGNSVNYKNLSVGANLGYFFGKIENIKEVDFINLSSPFVNRFDDDFSVGGVTWSLGAQYDFVLKTKENSDEPIEYITIGAYGNSANKININRDRRWVIINPTLGVLDSIPPVSGLATRENNSYLPGELGLGIMYAKKNKTKIGLDFKLQSWKEYVNDLVTISDTQDRPNVNTYRIALGYEYLPDELAYNNYFKKVRYRFGAFYSNDPRSIQNEQIKKYGITFGMGMPIILPRQGKSFVNFGLELGQLGIADALQRTYFKINLGFTLNDDTWFFKRKFN